MKILRNKKQKLRKRKEIMKNKTSKKQKKIHKIKVNYWKINEKIKN